MVARNILYVMYTLLYVMYTLGNTVLCAYELNEKDKNNSREGEGGVTYLV
jgi:hypothetical protein